MDKKKDVLNVLSLFSGGGGMDLGFEGGFPVLKDCVNQKVNPNFVVKEDGEYFYELKKTKFRTVFANDIFPDARNCWETYFAKKGSNPGIFRSESVVDLVKRHKSGDKIFPEKVDVVTGGFPCQDFSLSGKRKGFNSHKDHTGKISKVEIPSIETRGMLYMWMKEVIEITQPKMFVAENVKGLFNLGDVKTIIQNDFSNAGGKGYIVLPPKVLHAANYGVPQSRERIIFIGINKSYLTDEMIEILSQEVIPPEYDPYPVPSHSFNIQGKNLSEPVSLIKVFNVLEEPDVSNDPSQQHYSKAKFMGIHCQGQSEVKLNGIAPTIRAEHHGNIEFRRHSFERGGKNFDELNNGMIERRLSVRECGMIQTFPIDYEFVIPHKNKRGYLVSPSQAYKVIGNAVPPLLAYHIASRLEQVFMLYFKKNEVSVNGVQYSKKRIGEAVEENSK